MEHRGGPEGHDLHLLRQQPEQVKKHQFLQNLMKTEGAAAEDL